MPNATMTDLCVVNLNVRAFESTASRAMKSTRLDAMDVSIVATDVPPPPTCRALFFLKRLLGLTPPPIKKRTRAGASNWSSYISPLTFLTCASFVPAALQLSENALFFSGLLACSWSPASTRSCQQRKILSCLFSLLSNSQYLFLTI